MRIILQFVLKMYVYWEKRKQAWVRTCDSVRARMVENTGCTWDADRNGVFLERERDRAMSWPESISCCWVRDIWSGQMPVRSLITPTSHYDHWSINLSRLACRPHVYDYKEKYPALPTRVKCPLKIKQYLFGMQGVLCFEAFKKTLKLLVVGNSSQGTI